MNTVINTDSVIPLEEEPEEQKIPSLSVPLKSIKPMSLTVHKQKDPYDMERYKKSMPFMRSSPQQTFSKPPNTP
ncbi:hypothetical protein [Bartonella tribocorum]|uniref:hypothetical protein n=1 Tax=Bartonella tribocorum TaxID=85701 RepID=UPI000AE77FE4|nr:hypothetical protein [Bartonella tribocorum]